MSLFYLPVELLLHIGGHLPRRDLISFATTCKGIRKVFRTRMFGGTVQIRSPLPHFPGILELFNFLRLGMPGLQNCVDQVAFYQQQSDLKKSVHTVQIINWATPSPYYFQLATSSLANSRPQYWALLQAFSSYRYYPNALMQLRSVYDSIVVNLIQCLPFSELRLIRTQITRTMHGVLHCTPTLRRLALEDCIFESADFGAPFHIGPSPYEAFKATSGEANPLLGSKHLPWNGDDPYARGIFIQVYLFWGCRTITKLEICIQFLHDDALDRLSFPSMTSLAIVPYANIVCRMWSWRTVYLILKISPNLTCFRFEPLQSPAEVLYPFAETTNWKEYRRNIGKLPLSQLSSITSYRELVKRLVPKRPVSFIQILLFPDAVDPEINYPDPESDEDEDDIIYMNPPIVPYELARSATLIKTLYLQRIDEQEELEVGVSLEETIDVLYCICPEVTHIWIPSLKLSSRRRDYRDPVDMEEVLEELKWFEALERCAIGSCSPWVAKELEWYREGTTLRERMHPTLEELLLGVDVLWKWQDDSEVTGWVLYVSTDIEGSEDSEEAIYPDPVSSQEDLV